MTPMAAARVFAKRRAMYRAKAGKATERAFEAGDPEDNFYFERADRFRMAAEAIEYLWNDIKEASKETDDGNAQTD